MSIVLPTAGVYAVAVSRWNSTTNVHERVPVGASYTLHLSLQNHTYQPYSLAGTAATLIDNGNGAWTLGGLSTLTNLDGNYELLLSSVTSGVQDFASHPLTNDMSLKWTVDLTPPLVTIEPLTTISTRPEFVWHSRRPKCRR